MNMYKKVIIVFCLFLFTGCSAYSLNNLSNEDIIKLTINENNKLYWY